MGGQDIDILKLIVKQSVIYKCTSLCDNINEFWYIYVYKWSMNLWCYERLYLQEEKGV